MTLQEIAQNHWSGYVALRSDDRLSSHASTTFSFCDGRLLDVRVNNTVISNLETAMDSGKDDGYYICTKDRKPFYGTEKEYRIALGYN